MPTCLKKEFFDSKLLERVDKAQSNSNKNLETPNKIKNKAARKLPKKFLNKPANLKTKKEKLITNDFFKHQAQTTPHPLAMEIS